MHVAVDTRYICERPSGIGAYVRALVDRLPALAPQDHFTFWRHTSVEGRLSAAPNVDEHRAIGTPNEPFSLLFPRLFGPTDADVFHAPHNILGRGIRSAVVTTIHDIMWLDTPHFAEGSAFRRAFRVPFFRAGLHASLRRSTRILTVSRASADAILHYDPSTKGRVVVTHNAADPWFVPPNDRDAARARAARVLGTDAPYFLLVGQNAPYKGHALALEAFAAAATRGERLVLVQRLSAGRGLDALAQRLGIKDRLLVRPTLPQGDLVALLHGALALLQPSFAEGFGMPALEAMAAGCPVITSDIAPLVEVTGDAGLHFPSGSAEGLAAAMRRVASDPVLRAELAARGPERAKSFSWDTTAQTTLDVYHEAAALGPRP
ncbi:glycosyltransferase family 1 protein [Polyangium sp. 6x1]|uniref:glycosyltransferase family 4 protein n=1 Tax=Polyangium sp. 6x1 TaxID=3042689 RepID=UPI0024832238|nr:glycosyltransferase family 1 protein [Polyangium sp. 6x1]MDI1447451.1 glycosyltransferase family 1 protein [Polyangium sp. 6x1]